MPGSRDFDLLIANVENGLNTVIIFVLVPLALATALFFARPVGRNPYGSMPVEMAVPAAVATAVRKTLDVKGRAGRAEFWGYMLPALVLSLGTTVAAWWFHILPVTAIVVPLMTPAIAAGARRLHDIGRSGWWQLLALTGLGYIALLILWCLPSQTIEDADVSDLF